MESNQTEATQEAVIVEDGAKVDGEKVDDGVKEEQVKVDGEKNEEKDDAATATNTEVPQLISAPPTPTSVPVQNPFTAEDTIKLSMTADRKDDDLSLIVHVDDTQNDLDNDILDSSGKVVEDAAGASGAAKEGGKTDDAKTGETSEAAAGEEGKAASEDAKAKVAADGDKADADKKEGGDKKEGDKKDDPKAKRLVCIRAVVGFTGRVCIHPISWLTTQTGCQALL